MQTTQKLKQSANDALAQAPFAPNRLMLLYAGISAAVLLFFTIVTYLLQMQIDQTGGLGGIGLRSVLSTISTVLSQGINLAMPFFAIGYLSASLQMARRLPFSGSSLLDGFRSAGPVFRLMLLKGLLLLLPALFCFYPAMMIFLLTPFADSLTQTITPLLGETPDFQALLDNEAVIAAVEESTMPAMLIFLGLYLLVCIPLFYRLRLAELALMENPKAGAMAAIRKSIALTRRNCIRLLKMDISYWWYYLLTAVISVIAYGDVIAPYLGIYLPMNSQTAFFAFYIVYLAAQFGLRMWMMNRVQVSYVLLYDDLTLYQPFRRTNSHMPWNV